MWLNFLLKSFFQFKSEVKLGFSRCIQNTKHQWSRIRELKRQNTLKFSFNFFCSLWMKFEFWERIWDTKDLELWRGSKSKRTKKIECDQALFQEFFHSKLAVNSLYLVQDHFHTHYRVLEKGVSKWNSTRQRAPLNSFWVQPSHHSYRYSFTFSNPQISLAIN